jgi:DNA-binding GntR family transcriptional regulator
MAATGSPQVGRRRGGQPAVTDVAAAIRAGIVNGDYAPNQRLIEADLVETYGASRAIIRSALVEVAAEGLVDRLPNRGARVRSVSLDEAIEIVEVRMGLEGLCAAKAARQITDTEIEEFRRLRADMLAAVSRGELMEYSRLNRVLDQRIGQISGHRTATAILNQLRAQVVRHQFRLSHQPGRAAVSVPEHTAIIDAITARNPDLAEAATRAHLRSVIQALRATQHTHGPVPS